MLASSKAMDIGKQQNEQRVRNICTFFYLNQIRRNCIVQKDKRLMFCNLQLEKIQKTEQSLWYEYFFV